MNKQLLINFGIFNLKFVCFYLKGGLQRCDWTDISSDVLPYSELIYGIKKNLWKKVEILLFRTILNLQIIIILLQYIKIFVKLKL